MNEETKMIVVERKLIKSININNMTVTFHDEEMVPFQFQVCERCEGRGHHVNPSIDGNGLPTEYQNDPEFMEEYMSGQYDVPCEECAGNRVVPAIERETEAGQWLVEHYKFEYQTRLEYEAERRMGA